jgi:hypothetical protein
MRSVIKFWQNYRRANCFDTIPAFCYIHGSSAGENVRKSADRNRFLSGNNSAVECNLAKVEVAGSNPVSRFITHPLNTIFLNAEPSEQYRARSISEFSKRNQILCRSLLFSTVSALKKAFLRRRSQVVRQRSAKPLYIGSNPIAASI